jgi:hypothetical protein
MFVGAVLARICRSAGWFSHRQNINRSFCISSFEEKRVFFFQSSGGVIEQLKLGQQRGE